MSLNSRIVKKVLLWGIGLFGLLLLMLLRMPINTAQWLLPKNVALVQASGTLWDGRASAIGLEGIVLQQNVAWQFEPKALLGGTLAWQVRGEAMNTPSQARAVIGLRGVALENVDVSLPLEGVFRAIPKIAAWGLGGRAQLRSAHLSKNAGDSAELTLDPIFSQLVPALTPITALRANLNVVEGGAKWTIQPAGMSAIAVNGSGDLSWAGQGTAHGVIKLQPDEKVRQQLAPLLLQVPSTSEGYQLQF